MKKLLFLLTNFILLQASSLPPNQDDAVTSEKKDEKVNKGYFYIANGASSGVTSNFPCKAIGFGYQTKIFGHKCFQTSLLGSFQNYPSHGISMELYLPKFSFLYYINPKKPSSTFCGAGIYTSLVSPFVSTYKDDNKMEQIAWSSKTFEGGGISLTIGYNVALYAKVLQSFQLDFNLPMISFFNEEKKYEFYKHLYLNTFTLTYAIGY